MLSQGGMPEGLRAESALCIPGILALGPYRVWYESLHTSVPRFPCYEEQS